MNGLEKEHGHTHVGLYVQAMAKWLAVALVTGVCCGVVGSLFHIGVERATELREQHPWLLWCLPAAGLVIVAFYKLTKTEGQGTNDIIDAVHHGKPLSIWLLPAIFLSVELFGDGGLLYFALVCGISYMLSGYNGLYSSQTIVYSKLKAQYINVRTNAYHAGEPVAPFQQGGGEETERD